jgi:cytochrome c peroxidase
MMTGGLAGVLCVIMAAPFPALAAPGDVLTTPVTPMELPIEVEIELSPAGSLKQAPLWRELVQLMEHPYSIVCPPDDPSTPLTDESNYCTATIERRPGFGVNMPPLNVYSLRYNFLTGQPLRLRTSDGEVSWDQPGPMFDPGEDIAVDDFNTPTELRTVIGHLVACPDNGAYQAVEVPAEFCSDKPDGSLVVYNPIASAIIPPNGTVVAVSAVNGAGQLLDEDGEVVTELETPVNEVDFFRPTDDTTAVPVALQPYLGRPGAEVLGKALFWDMQVGSDGVQACGTCHFHAGADNRTRNQLNPGTMGGDLDLEVFANRTGFDGDPQDNNQDVVASDFPFHKRSDPDLVGDGTAPGVAASDANDIMSSMGVSQFNLFVDIQPIGNTSFGPPVMGVRPLLPDIGEAVADPIPLMQDLRRVEPRHTPTFHGAAFNFDNFWDGRARFNFNGGSVFGPSDPTPHIFINPGLTIGGGGEFVGATMGHIRPDLAAEDPEVAEQPVRIKFSSLASQAVGPPLSDFEMSFAGRNWPKIGKKLLQGEGGNIQNQGNGAPQQAGTNRENAAVPLANQLVATDDSRLGPFSNQGGSVCQDLGRPTEEGKPGLCISYGDLTRLAFARQFWNRNNRHLEGAAAVCTGADENGFPTPAGCDPFDGYVLTPANGPANPNNTSQFTQMEANFSLFFGLAVQAYETLTIPDDTPADRFFDANPNAGHGVGEPGDQAVLFPTLVPDLVDDGQLNGSQPGLTPGVLTLIPDDPSTPEYDGFGPDELFGFDIFAGANLTAALPAGSLRNPLAAATRPDGTTVAIATGSNPFTRSAKCMLCHLGPEQTDHSINISHGLLKNDAEFEYPTPPFAPDPNNIFGDGLLPAPEPSGSSRTVAGLILAEEITEGAAQDAVEVEPRNFATFNDPATPWDDRIISQPGNFAFGDQGVYNIGLRPSFEDSGRGGDDSFGWPLSLSALTLKNIGGQDFEPGNIMTNFDPFNIGATFEETGDGAVFPGTTHTLQSINPGFERDPIVPQMPEYMVPWMHSLPAGELHPQIDEMAGMVPNTLTPPNGGPGIEFPEVLFGADPHCARYDPALFGMGPPNFGWGPPSSDERLCPQHQSGVAGNFDFPSQGTWPDPNRVLRDGAFKAPPLRNVELTGPYFHTGSYLTLRQVVDFYMRGGDFPLTNAENRDPHIVDIEAHAFSFGPTNLIDDPAYTNVNSGILVGSFGDGLPDTVFLYDELPDTNHPITPEYASLEDAKVALVKFLLALTDPRVKYERAPFDRPEIFVPIDGTAPENYLGRTDLVTDARFRHLPAVGAGGSPTPQPNFLGISSTPVSGPNNDHFDR